MLSLLYKNPIHIETRPKFELVNFAVVKFIGIQPWQTSQADLDKF
jgi:hypothetical protein